MDERLAVDQMGNKVTMKHLPKRILSLVPSQTELLYDLGLDEKVVGITQFCELPAVWKKTKKKVGGTKRLRLDVIEALNPDLILGNKEENDKSSIGQLKKKYPVWMSDIISFQDALDMIQSVSILTGKTLAGEAIIQKIQSAFSTLTVSSGMRVLYLIWKNPWMGVGGKTFINTMLTKMHLVNVLTGVWRYPSLSEDQIRVLHPDKILLSSEPFPFREEHIKEIAKIVPDAEIQLVDGRFFSWYGSRLVHAPAYFNRLHL